MIKKTHATTETVIAAILACPPSLRIAPALFTHCYGRAVTAAAFRMAKSRGLIEVWYMSCAGTPVYRLTASAAGNDSVKE